MNLQVLNLIEFITSFSLKFGNEMYPSWFLKKCTAPRAFTDQIESSCCGFADQSVTHVGPFQVFLRTVFLSTGCQAVESTWVF